MTRNFPNDENGDVLRRMYESGDDLSKPRYIDFAGVFPTELEAASFAAHFREMGYTTAYKRSELVAELPWNVVITSFMVPDHAAITELENLLQRIASPLSGRNDGWGCFERPGIDH